MSKDSEHRHSLNVDHRTWLVTEVDRVKNGYKIEVDTVKVPVNIIQEPGLDSTELVAEINGRVFVAEILEKDENKYAIRLNGQLFSVGLDSVQAAAQAVRAEETSRGPMLVSAPMSGRVVSLNISTESKVTSGQSLVVLEAMKMQNDISAPKSGIVKEVYVQAGTPVKAGDKLCLIE